MKSKIFSQDEEKSKIIRKTNIKPSEAADIINYSGHKLKEEVHSAKPNYNKILKKDLTQKNTLTGIAKVYKERILRSQISYQ